uniref:Uncharacterized protein n=1 Tax=Oryza meridionalis TaxID=40149 RepID=A0A0E0E5P4_9ORYZ
MGNFEIQHCEVDFAKISSKSIASEIDAGICPVKLLLLAFRATRWLKLTSRTAMLLNNNESIGRPPERELWERLRCNNLARLLRDGEMLPARPLEGSEISLTVFSPLQLVPSHEQQSVPSAQDMLRPPLCSGESCATKPRELCSCSVKELVGEAKKSRTPLFASI